MPTTTTIENDIESSSSSSSSSFAYEEDVKKNPLSVISWIRYLDFKNDATQPLRNSIYERAVQQLPRSYKLWSRYLNELLHWVRGKCLGDKLYDQINDTFERSLIFLDKMPRIWIKYLNFLISQSIITKTRKTFDRSLKSLPITQHDRIWELYIGFVKKIGIMETTTRVFKRWLKVEPEAIEDYIEYLLQINAWGEATKNLILILENDRFRSKKGKTRHQLWQQLCELVARHPREISLYDIDCDSIIRSGISTFKLQAGKLWCGLADYYVQLAQFDKARDIFEEAMNQVATARDFSQIWDSYTLFEDSLLSSMELEMDINSIDFELIISRYENLISRQPLLLNNVLLRQNPHNIGEWHKRVLLYQGNPKMVVETYVKAISTIDPLQSQGKMYTIWAAFGQYYESHDKMDQARKIFERGIKSIHRTIDDLASLYCEYVEMELRHKNYDNARSILSRATISPRRLIHIPDTEPVQKRLWRSLKLWLFYVDLEESFGTFLSTRSIYEKMIQLKVVTPQVIQNYCNYLEENNYFEDSFKIYEQGINLFPFSNSFDLWLSYLIKFINRYGSQKLERIRDLFEQVLLKVTTKESKIFYLMYANLEEQFGLARHSMQVYDRATRSVAPEDRYNMYLLYINRTTEFYGLAKTREIYTRAIESLPDDKASDMCIRFAEMERQHGEIDRARSIFIHGSQFSEKSSQFWSSWNDFEKSHGNQETVRDMFRIKRTINNNQIQFEPTTKSLIQQKQQPIIQQQKESKNDDEIDLDMIDDDENDSIEEKQLPKTLFTSNIK